MVACVCVRGSLRHLALLISEICEGNLIIYFAIDIVGLKLEPKISNNTIQDLIHSSRICNGTNV